MSDKNKNLTARQFAVKAIHEDNLNVRNPSILAKLLKDFSKSSPISKVPSDKEIEKKFPTIENKSSVQLTIEQMDIMNTGKQIGAKWLRDKMTTTSNESEWISVEDALPPREVF